MPKEFSYRDTDKLSRRFASDFSGGLQRVPQEDVVDFATGISEFYQLSMDLFQQGTHIPVFRATDNVMMEAQRQEALWKKITPDTDDGIAQGVTLTFPGMPIILIGQDVGDYFPIKLRHELIHGMAPLDSDKSYNSANEAVVSVLEVSRRNKGINFYEPNVPQKQQQTLFGKIARGEEGLSYREASLALMFIMAATYFGEQPFTPRHLAHHYFEGGDNYQIPLELELMEKIPAPVFEAVKPHFRIFNPFVTTAAK